MRYYRYIEDLEYNTTRLEVIEYIKIHKGKINSFWTNIDFQDFCKFVPSILTVFNPLNLTVKRVAFTAAVKDIGIHRDKSESVARINLPIINCEHSITKFWKTETEPTLLHLPNGVPYLFLDEKDCTLVDSICLNKPAVLRIAEPHSIHVQIDKIPRISLTVEFHENIEHLLND